jgi:hypothetical protein
MMRRFEALATWGRFEFGEIYTFTEPVPQIILNATMVGLLRQLPQLATGGIVTSQILVGQDSGVEEARPIVAPKTNSTKRSRRKAVDAADISAFVAEILDESDGQA